MNIDDIVINVKRIMIENWNSTDLNIFTKTKKKDLVMYHRSLGMAIRNEYKLWTIPWEPELKNGIDCSPNHPDQVSNTIIEKVWESFQK